MTYREKLLTAADLIYRSVLDDAEFPSALSAIATAARAGER
jgi:hypothetical protein